MTIGCFAGFDGFDCSLLWIAMIVLFFIAAIARRQISDTVDAEFSLIGATIAGEIGFVLLIFITHSFKWSILAGIITLLIGGFILAPVFGDGEGGD